MRAIWKFYLDQLAKRPITTKGVSTGIMIGTGDILSNWITGTEWDKRRTLLMSLYGATILTPYSHYWLEALNRLIPLAQKTNKFPWLVASVVLDQTIAFPPSIVMYMSARGLVDGMSTSEIREKVKNTFWSAYINGVQLWGTAQLFNFYFIPLEHRVVFLSVVSLVWNTFLAVRASAKTKRSSTHEQ